MRAADEKVLQRLPVKVSKRPEAYLLALCATNYSQKPTDGLWKSIHADRKNTDNERLMIIFSPA